MWPKCLKRKKDVLGQENMKEKMKKETIQHQLVPLQWQSFLFFSFSTFIFHRPTFVKKKKEERSACRQHLPQEDERSFLSFFTNVGPTAQEKETEREETRSPNKRKRKMWAIIGFFLCLFLLFLLCAVGKRSIFSRKEISFRSLLCGQSFPHQSFLKNDRK